MVVDIGEVVGTGKGALVARKMNDSNWGKCGQA
jgi:hypothetical protein